MKFDSKDDAYSYCMGLSLGSQVLHGLPFKLNKQLFLKSMTLLLKGERPDITQEEFETNMSEIYQKMEEAHQAAHANCGNEENRKKGEAYLAENKKKAGVIETASGLQIEHITEGAGASPKATDKVRVHYEGSLLDGTVFDSSYKRGETIDFGLNQVIPGWTEGLQLMKKGGKARLVIPSDLAYGKHGAGAAIPPDSTLIFIVELIDIL